MSVVIVNTGCANISSVKFAIERLGYQVEVSDQPEQIKAADKVFLPGVGTAKAAMASINQKQLVGTIQSLEQPVLGICLGMQLLTQGSEEGQVDCLGLVDANVERMQVGDLRLPHMGWNQINKETEHALFNGIDDGTYFYFVHSYAVQTGNHTLASCDYGSPFSAAIYQNNFMGVQFHPERSGDAGAELIRNFLTL